MSRQTKIALILLTCSLYPFIYRCLNLIEKADVRIYLTIGFNVVISILVCCYLLRKKQIKLVLGVLFLFPIYQLSCLAVSSFDYFKTLTLASANKTSVAIIPLFNLGVDYEKRDIFSTMVISGFNAFCIVLIAIYVSLILGTIFGIFLSSQNRILRFFSTVITQFFEIVPQLFFVLISIGVYNVWASFDPATRLNSDIAVPLTGVVIGVSSLPFMSRVIENRISDLYQSRFVEVLKCSNVGSIKILFYNILWKNTISEILIQISYLFGATILLETALGYAYKIGFGDLGSGGYLSWGKILAESRRSVLFGENISIIAYPIIVTLVTILGANIVGDYLAKASRENHKN